MLRGIVDANSILKNNKVKLSKSAALHFRKQGGTSETSVDYDPVFAPCTGFCKRRMRYTDERGVQGSLYI